MQTQGLFGLAEDSITYPWLSWYDPTGTSVALSKPGSISFWAKIGPHGTLPGTGDIFDGYASNNLFVVDAPTGTGADVYYLDDANVQQMETAAIPTTSASLVDDVNWHLLVINWTTSEIGVSLDGRPQQLTHVDWQGLSHSYGTSLGTLMYFGGTGFPGGARDEVLVLNRPMTDAEIWWYYSTAKAGGPAGMNPAVAYFSASTTACNRWDDLNPCTVDSCNSTTGAATATAVADGTSCSDGNACNGVKACSAGVCTASMVPPTNDGNVCTVDSCDPATGTVRNDAMADGTACDDNDPRTILSSCLNATCQAKPEGPNYGQLIDLGMVIPTDVYSIASGINAAGDVVGEEDFGEHYLAFRYSDTDRKQQVDYAVRPDWAFYDWAVGINASGTVVGYSFSHDQTITGAFIADQGASARQLFPGSTNSIAYGINDAGQVTGVSDSVSSYGFRLSGGPDGTLLPIPAPPGAEFNGVTWGEAIGPGGEVAGSAMRNDESVQFDDGFVLSPGGQLYNAILYTDAGGTQNLNDYAAANGWQFILEANATNGNQTVGWGVINGHCHGFRYTSGTNQITDLGTMPTPGFESAEICPTADVWNFPYRPISINNRGEIVGYIGSFGVFYYNDNIGMVNLQDFIDPALGVTSLEIGAINDNDEIAGDMQMSTGGRHAFRMKLPTNLTQPVTLRMDGIVDTSAAQDGSGPFVAVFGHDNIASNSYHATTDNETINGHLVSNPQPAPPEVLAVGSHPGSFLPRFRLNETVAWDVDGQVVLASVTPGTTIFLPHQQVGPEGSSAYGVVIDGVTIPIQSDTTSFKTPPQEPTYASDPVTGGAFPGVLSGTLGVGPGGAAIYTVPISIPPGVAGMSPNLSLTYNSQAADGIAGQGWDLSGSSVIQRCPKTRARDGYARPIMMDAIDPQTQPDETQRDGLCLDGQRLFLRPGTTSQYDLEGKDFSTIKMVSDGANGGQFFVVVLKTGERRYYGSRPASRVQGPLEGPDGIVASGALETAIWPLDRVMDEWGNYYLLHYDDEQGQSGFAAHGVRLSSIEYTGHVGSSDPKSPAVDPFYTIFFDYLPRTDIRRQRFRDTVLIQNSRLAGITTPKGRYLLSYVTNSPSDEILLPSRLEKISFCQASAIGSGGDCTLPEGQQVQPLTFDWGGGSNYGWASVPDYALPVDVGVGSGTQFVDVDGDGRVDLVQAKAGSTRAAWRNTGTSFVPAPSSWILPGDLITSDNKPKGTFADFDGDGLLDFMTDEATATVCTQTSILNCVVDVSFKPAVFMNRNKENPSRGWVINQTLSTAIPSNNPSLNLSTIHLSPTNPSGNVSQQVWRFLFGGNPPPPTMDTIVDMNGDGLADWVRIQPDWVGPMVLLNTPGPNGNTWTTDVTGHGNDLAPPGQPLQKLQDYTLQDVNDDGLPDYVHNAPDNTFETQMSLRLALNTGRMGAMPTGVWQWGTIPSDLVANTYASQPPVYFGDVDGDGMTDHTFVANLAGISYGTGFGHAVTGWWGVWDAAHPATDPHVAALQAFHFPYMTDKPLNFTDINGDGLIDYIQGHLSDASDGSVVGQVLVNTGNTFADINGATAWQTSAGSNAMPFVPEPYFGTFIDLDGDGITDIASTTGSWRNTFQRPAIRSFSAGLAKPTAISYSIISTADAQMTMPDRPPIYADTADLDPGSQYFTVPLMVVAYVDEDNGVGSINRTGYGYNRLRTSSWGRGPQGFHDMTVYGTPDPAVFSTGLVTTTTFAQSYPYTGRPVSVTKSNQGKITETITKFCDTLAGNDQCTQLPGYTTQPPPGQALFLFPVEIDDTSYLRTSTYPEPQPAEKIETKTTYQYDAYGNPIVTTMKSTMTSPTNPSGGSYQKQVINGFGDDGGPEQQFGKVKSSITTTTRLDDNSVPAITQSLTMQYETPYHFTDPVTGEDVQSLSLSKKMVEEGAEAANLPGIELHTAYAYDGFGNVTTTTMCANDFGSCAPDATSPGIPFRTTKTSYDPADFNPAPSGVVGGVTTLAYHSVGRFPVKTTAWVNGIEHVSYSAYDPLFGNIVQSTDPNGLHTYYGYDDFGREIRRTNRFGTEFAATTETFRNWTSSQDGFRAPVVTITIEPTGAANWVYTDVLGHIVVTKQRTLNGRISRKDIIYDGFGRPYRTAKPAFDGDPQYWISTSYDELSRVKSTTQNLDTIDTVTNSVGTANETTWYGGSSTTTQHTVQGSTRSRTETKNTLGLVSSVVDDHGKSISYSYDAIGNLVKTTDSQSNSVTIHYDRRNRKDYSTDPDLGTWYYTYDGFGDVLTQTDAKNQVVTMTYDELGRVLTKADTNQNTAEWVYDRGTQGARIGKVSATIGMSDPRLAGGCPDVPLVSHVDGNRPGRWFIYNDAGDMSETYDCIDGEVFQTSYNYDSAGRITSTKYPQAGASRFMTQNFYNSIGFLRYVADGAGAVLWSALDTNANGQITSEMTGNGVETTSVVNPSTGWLLSTTSKAHADSNTIVQDMSFGYDEAGNLLRRSRTDELGSDSSTETFDYDSLDRLTGSHLRINSRGYVKDESYGYDDGGIGNLVSKNGKNYTYGTCNAGPHAVCQVGGGVALQYDLNGGMVGNSERSIKYDPLNRVKYVGNTPTVEGDSKTGSADFVYGADDSRVVQSIQDSSGGRRTVYVGLGATGRSLYERSTVGAGYEHTHFVYAGGAHGGGAVVVRVTSTGAGASDPITRYNHFDHLNSTTAVSDEVGHVVGAASGGADATAMGYDAWGARRNSDGTEGSLASFALPPGHRGFTGQETIPDVGLINMNGRLYDPELGRFLSADPHIQFAADLQSYNRYSYVQNNPLRYTDPTGYFLSGGFDMLVEVAIGVAAIYVCGSAGAESAMGCGIGFMALAATYSAVSSHYAGAPWGQAATTAGVGLVLGAGLGGGLGQLFGKTLTASIVSGAVSGAIGGVFGSATSGQGIGWNVLAGAFEGAAFAAFNYGISQPLVSQRSRGESQGDDMTTAAHAKLAGGRSWEDLGESPPPETAAGVAKYAKTHGIAPLPGGWKYQVDDQVTDYNDQPVWGWTQQEKSIVHIAKGAFESPDALAGVLDHERVHVQQVVSRNLAMKDRKASHRLNEYEAYTHEVAYLRSRGADPEFINTITHDDINMAHLGDYYDEQLKADPTNFRIRREDVWTPSHK